MNYSIRNYIKKNCTEKYTLSEIDALASDISNDSNGRYTNNSALKILYRYASVKDGKICFNVDARNSDQSIDDIKKQLSISNQSDIRIVKAVKTNKTITKSPIIDSITHTEKKSDSIKIVKTQNLPKKNGFGNLSTARKIIDMHDSDSPINKKIINSNNFNEQKNIAGIESNSNKINKENNDTSIKRNRNLFASATTAATENNKSIDNKSIDNKSIDSKSIDNKSIDGKIVKSDEKISNTTQKKGGFGILNRTLIKSPDSDEINTKNLLKRTTNNRNINNDSEYRLPIEKQFRGVVRNEKQYGPYGTDNYHDNKSQDDVFTEDVFDRIKIYRELASRYYPPQRSVEWFKLRDEMITASDGGTIVKMNPYERDFDFITKKVFGRPFETSLDCYHGKKYEQVATMIYEYRMNVKIKEFGLCRHPKYRFLGASPDGIVSEYKLKTRDGRLWSEIEHESNMIEDEEDRREYLDRFGIKTKFVGRMLEIKCPLRRKILMSEKAPEVYGPHGEEITDLKKDCKKGICPAYYWVQVQLQLQCCDLDECDFWQCEIFEYADKEDFLEDTDSQHPWLSRQTGHEKGAVIQLMPYEQVNNRSMDYKDRIYNYAQFIYQPKVNMTPAEIDEWILKTLLNLKITHRGMVFESIKFWKTINTHCITIKRDVAWFNDNLPAFERAWNYVEYFRANKDKAKLLKRYINTFPLDYYKKVKEPPRSKGIIMKNLEKIVAEPSDNESDKSHKLYAKFIANLEKLIEESTVEEPKDYDSCNDINYIREALCMKIPDELDEDQKKEHEKKFIEFVKNLKIQVQNYLFQDEDEAENNKD